MCQRSSYNESIPNSVEEASYLIEDICLLNSIVLMLSQIDDGVSLLGTDIALHVASGIPWMGRNVGQGSVIMYGHEGLIWDELREAWRIRHGLAVLPNNYRPLSEIDLTSSSCVERVCQDVESLHEASGQGIKLIGIDAVRAR